jgi:hypothetical protein
MPDDRLGWERDSEALQSRSSYVHNSFELALVRRLIVSSLKWPPAALLILF